MDSVFQCSCKLHPHNINGDLSSAFLISVTHNICYFFYQMCKTYSYMLLSYEETMQPFIPNKPWLCFVVYKCKLKKVVFVPAWPANCISLCRYMRLDSNVFHMTNLLLKNVFGQYSRQSNIQTIKLFKLSKFKLGQIIFNLISKSCCHLLFCKITPTEITYREVKVSKIKQI